MRRRRQAWETPEMQVKKHDTVKVLQKQRAEARDEITRVKSWIAGTSIKHVDAKFFTELHQKLDYVKDKILREDINAAGID